LLPLLLRLSLSFSLSFVFWLGMTISKVVIKWPVVYR
jgi:hypothetical protein